MASAAADLFAREHNEDSTAESLAEELAVAVTDKMVMEYETIQAKSYNLVVVAQFQLPGGNPYTAAMGPLSTRAAQRARDVGQRFAWDYRTRTGEGVFTLVPLVRNPNEAWDEARKAGLGEYVSTLTSVVPGEELTYEPMRFELDMATRQRIATDLGIPAADARRFSGPACLCGLREELACPRHPDETGER